MGKTHHTVVMRSPAAAAPPFAVWLYLAIEQLPLAAEESHDPKKDMPKGLMLGIATLVYSPEEDFAVKARAAAGLDKA